MGYVFALALMACAVAVASVEAETREPAGGTNARQSATAEKADVAVSGGKMDASGFVVHEVTSPYQGAKTTIRVLLPGKLESGKKYPVVYVLPVEGGTQYGDGLVEAKKGDLHNKHQAVFVAMSFSQVPWYGDHPTDTQIRQESHLLKAVLPFVEKTYPVGERYLLGFSKSGWGAFSLLLRHPDVFARAAAWDAPMMKSKPDQFLMEKVFGTQENFEKYQVSRLLEKEAEKLAAGRDRGESPRLILLGYDVFRKHHQEAHALMEKLKIPHVYADGPRRKHEWGSGWMGEAVEALMKDRK